MRKEIFSAVENQPGIHFKALKRNIDCSNETLYYHLERDSALEDVKIRGYRRVYPAKVDQKFQSPLAALNHESRGPIIDSINQNPGIIASSIQEELELPASTVSRHLKLLDDSELVIKEKDGRKKRYRTTEVTKKSISRYGRKVLDRFADNFIDTWSNF